jgi:hypothetical protein
MNDILYDSEQITDYEFLERIYLADDSNSMFDFIRSKNLIWGNFSC